MEAKAEAELPTGSGWWYEPKWDGFRCLAFKDGEKTWLQAKSGKDLTRFFPEVALALAASPAPAFVVDGELTIETPSGLSFEALQMRLHPAQSRIDRLSRETPAQLVVFDLIAGPAGSLVDRPWRDRQSALSDLWPRLAGIVGLRRSEGTADREEAGGWLAQGVTGRDGVVAKQTEGSYTPGVRSMVKVKRIRTADCVVGGFRYLAGTPEVGSLLLGLYDDAGRLDHVGFTSTVARQDRPALTRRLEALAGGSGFTGAAPGAPSRWSDERSSQWTALRPELVVEVAFDHVSGGRFRHGTRLLRWRPDKRPEQCRREQLDA